VKNFSEHFRSYHKDVNFLTNEMMQMKLKLYPVQYMDQPAVKVIIKEKIG